MADYTPQHIESIFLDTMSGEFEAGAKTLMEKLNEAKEALTADPSNPSVLAEFQSKLQAYTLFRNAQTSTVKAYKDIGAAIIQNFR
ncbi:type III secretion system needle filament subunit SctF [Symbiopectobacterium purcellii]|uniref:Type III secretion system needle filament subunit SctF n=1 Tax=Symbiopectobacterium purcellii TaxID=2871826 RepID=A0ABX9AMH5_9ENTR|nr:type III secretion system needle filament subunit SctF [Symbiopectobacterium purcellii]QZN95256.1 type III secretion system needle filament subunit SctF [Symbiopectobacterium purcellii]